MKRPIWSFRSAFGGLWPWDLSQTPGNGRRIHLGGFLRPGDHSGPISIHFGDLGPDPLSETSTSVLSQQQTSVLSQQQTSVLSQQQTSASAFITQHQHSSFVQLWGVAGTRGHGCGRRHGQGHVEGHARRHSHGQSNEIALPRLVLCKAIWQQLTCIFESLG